ncbi:hypothetical protein [Acinetobacter seifertii]|uniref:hypothetical protein n=1 Tax=Acinetobacter seifertii TaxID=1530123 RepID=UPI00148C5A91|nr:hypothetical protein [Acinetobacter seifertii]
MSIVSILKSIVSFLEGIWKKIPQETKDKIIEEILKQISTLLREFFKRYKQKQSSK